MRSAPPELGLDAPSHPFAYNASAWSQRIPIAVFAAAGFVIAAYMGLYQWGFVAGVWDPVFGGQTERVLRSDVSLAMERWFLVPDAILGALAYLGDAIYGLAGSTRRWQMRPWMTLLFGLDVIPLGAVSIVLVVMQGAVVGAWCFLCLVTAAISLVLIYYAYDEIVACVRFLAYVWRETGDRRLLWNVIWGSPGERGARLAWQFVEGRTPAGRLEGAA